VGKTEKRYARANRRDKFGGIKLVLTKNHPETQGFWEMGDSRDLEQTETNVRVLVGLQGKQNCAKKRKNNCDRKAKWLNCQNGRPERKKGNSRLKGSKGRTGGVRNLGREWGSGEHSRGGGAYEYHRRGGF